MNENASIALARKLHVAVGLLELALSEEADQRSLRCMRARREASVLAADLKAALEEPLKVKPWTPFTQGNAE